HGNLVHLQRVNPLGGAGAMHDDFLADLQAADVFDVKRMRSDGHVIVGDLAAGLFLAGLVLGIFIGFEPALSAAADNDERTLLDTGGPEDGSVFVLSFAAQNDSAGGDFDRIGDSVFA